MKKYIMFILSCILVFTSCDDLFSPSSENLQDINQIYDNSSYAQGLLVTVYRTIPNYYDNTEYATDDAVTNQLSNSYLKMATGSWSASNNPVNMWVTCYGAIQYINLFLENADKVKWADDVEPANLFKERMVGEAYGMRALFMYYLVRNHAGFSSDNQLLGVPILSTFLNATSDFNLPRATFVDCIKQIYQDLDSADVHLPMEFENVNSDSDIPARFQVITKNKNVYNRVMGQYARQLFNGLISKAFRAKVALLAASPAFQDSSNPNSWAYAADVAANVLDYIGGVNGIDPRGVTYYANANVDSLSNGINPKEIIWRASVAASTSDQESQNFPPSIGGSGYMNPTQNLVDAFPMSNGYPISDSRSGYDPNNPYAGRDPRFANYIIYNGSLEGVSNTPIYTGSASTTADGILKSDKASYTGYYMKKRLRMDVNQTPGSTNTKPHFVPRIRYTEIFLSYAEAANEAWGPTDGHGHSYSAYDVIKAIRLRAGIKSMGAGLGDAYLESIKSDKDKMRDLIRNERRLELCFESFRFWDLRRWKVANLNETARGMDVSKSNLIFDAQTRSYSDYMYYGPIPYSEILKYDQLKQNKGW